MYIDGEWVGSLDGSIYQDMDPYTGDVFAEVPSGGRADMARAVEAATAAFPAWSSTSPGERQRLFLKAAQVLEGKRDELVALIAQETGGTFGWAMFQSTFTPGLLREAAGQVHHVKGEIIPADLPGAFYMALRQPVGVVAGISPWNAPVILSLRSICLPIAYGNTAVLKPSTESAVVGGLILAEVFHEAGFPKGVLNVVTNGPGRSGELGDELIENRAVRRIGFTGSSEVGRLLAEKAGRHLKRVALELGGHNPLIVLKDADIDYAVQVAAFGAFLHQGQICMSVRRVIVEEPVAREFTDKFAAKAATLKVGDPKEMDTVIGPLINADQLAKVERNVNEAIAAGATALTGARSEGLCYHPTVVVGMTPDSRLCCEETFGPVVTVQSVGDVAEAIREANNTPYGLSAGVVTRDFELGLSVAERIESGIVHINDSSVGDEPQVPFGGMKDSGWGRMGGTAAKEEFTELRWVTMQRTPRHYPF